MPQLWHLLVLTLVGSGVAIVSSLVQPRLNHVGHNGFTDVSIRAGDQQARLQGLGDTAGTRGNREKVERGAVREESESERGVDRR